jgi:general secretion pathway protein K
MMTTLTAIKAFLLRERSLGRRAKRPARRRPQRGVALVAVMISIAISLVIANEFGTSTNGDMIAAANYRDQMRAHFLARSAVSLSELVIRVQQRIDNVKELRDAGIRITDFADQVLLAFCGTAEEVRAAVGMSPSDAKGLGADIGTCGVTGQITTEDDKLNLNCANSNAQVAATVKSALDSLIYFPAYDPLFEDADAEDYRRDRATQVAAIIDYIDNNGQRLREFGTTEDYGYESLKDRYRPKNNYLDTIGELRLARGVDDRFWTMFGSSFTVYGGCKTNLSAISNVQLIAALLQLTAKNQNDPVLLDPSKLFTLASLMAKAKQFGVQFNSVKDFSDFAKDPSAALLGLLGKAGSGAGVPPEMQDAINKLTGGQKIGLELDTAKLNQLAVTGPRRTYRVEAWGEIERKQKNADGTPVFPPIRSTITGVWDTRVTPQNFRKQPPPRGAWAYQRED